MTPPIRQEKEKLVLDLYYNQGKSYRQIAKEARNCPRDIKAILERPAIGMELKQSMSASSQAYKLFSEGKTPLQVAIALNLRDAEVTELYKEYWNLKNLHDINQVYEEIKGDIYSFVKLYRLAKAVGMNTQHVVNLLTIANNYLPSVKYGYEKLKREAGSLQASNQNSAITFQQLSDEISYLHDILDSYRSSCEEERRQMGELYQKKIRLEALVDDIENNSEEYMKIIKAVEEKVLGVLSDKKTLLRYALLSITESARNDPERCRLIFYNMSSQENPSSDYDTEANAAIIVEEADKLYKKLVKDCINKTITDHTFNKSPLLLLAPPNEQQSHVRSRPTVANHTRICREEHTFIQSEVHNEDQDDQIQDGK